MCNDYHNGYHIKSSLLSTFLLSVEPLFILRLKSFKDYGEVNHAIRPMSSQACVGFLFSAQLVFGGATWRDFLSLGI